MKIETGVAILVGVAAVGGIGYVLVAKNKQTTGTAKPPTVAPNTPAKKEEKKEINPNSGNNTTWVNDLIKEGGGIVKAAFASFTKTA